MTGVPLKVTVLDPRFAPKFKPVIVTSVPTGAAVGFNRVISGPSGITPPPSMISTWTSSLMARPVPDQPGLIATSRFPR